MYIYVIGRGRSGSTILDIALSQSRDVVGVGELVSGLGRHGEICSCGVPSVDCTFWNDVVGEFKAMNLGGAEAVGGALREVSTITYLPWALFGRKSARAEMQRRLNASIHTALQSVSQKSLVVDSSKEITRGVLLHDALKNSGIKFIHLVRDPAKVASSKLERVESGNGFKFMRVVFSNRRYRFIYLTLEGIGWTVGNMIIELLSAWKLHAIRVRYEDLCERPEMQIGILEKELGTDLGPTLEFLKGEKPAESFHNLGGNRERHKKRNLFDAGRSKGRQTLRRWELAWVRFLTWPMRKVYGY